MSEILDEHNAIGIGSIGNYYGGLQVIHDNNKFYWGIENHDGTDWEEIPESLYNELMRFKP